MKAHAKVSLIYFVAGILWILGSDQLVTSLTDNIESLTFLQTAKGWIFVGLSTLLIYGLTKRACAEQERLNKEKKAVFKKTVEGSYHILLNYLNQMQLITLEAERCASFDPDLLEQAQRISQEAVNELRKLDELEEHAPEAIEAFVYRKLQATREVLEKPPQP